MAGALAEDLVKAEKALNSFDDTITITTNVGTRIHIDKHYKLSRPICIKETGVFDTKHDMCVEANRIIAEQTTIHGKYKSDSWRPINNGGFTKRFTCANRVVPVNEKEQSSGKQLNSHNVPTSALIGALNLPEKQRNEIRNANISHQQLSQLGRVRASNLHEVVTALKMLLGPNEELRQYVHPSHRTAPQLLADLRGTLGKDDSKKAPALQQRARKPWQYLVQTQSTPKSAATHVISVLNVEQRQELQDRLHKALFAYHDPSKTTYIPQLRDGLIAEAEVKKRILTNGIALPHPVTKKIEIAYIVSEIDGDCLIGRETPELSGKPDFSGVATFTDCSEQNVIIEIKHYSNPLTDWHKAGPSTRCQLHSYAFLAQELSAIPTVYLLQADSRTNPTGTVPGSSCELRDVVRIETDEVRSEWTSWYCKLARETLEQLAPHYFRVGSNIEVTSAKQAVVPRENTKTKRTCNCPAYLSQLRFHVNHNDVQDINSSTTQPPGKDSGTWYNLKTGFYWYGDFNLSHIDHKAVSSTANSKQFSNEEKVEIYTNSVNVGITPRMLTNARGIGSQKSRNLLNAGQKLRDEANREDLAKTITPAHTLEAGMEELNLCKEAVYVARYAMIRRRDVTVPTARVYDQITIMHLNGKMYDITNVTTYSWSYSEHIVYAEWPTLPTIMKGCREITNLETLRASEFPIDEYVWRCDALCWSMADEVRRGTTCMERFCWDATFGTSSSENPLMRIVATDAEYNSVVIGTALIMRQSEACFRVFFRTHVSLMYGRALNMHMTTMSDGDPKLAKIATEAAILESRGKHGIAVTLCAFHAMDKVFREVYDRSHGLFDGGTGETLLAALREMLQSSESQEEATVQLRLIKDWLAKPNPVPAQRFKSQPLRNAASAVYTGRSRTKARQLQPPSRRDTKSYDIAAYVAKERFVDVEFVRVRWTCDPRTDTWEPASHLLKELGEVTHKRLLRNLAESPAPINPEHILNIGSRLGNDGTLDVSGYYSVESLWDRYERGTLVLYRVHWFGYEHNNDTFETRASLCEWIKPDVLASLENARINAYRINPNPSLPEPSHTANNNVLGGIRMGYTHQRRYILNQFVIDIENLQHSLSLWARRHVRHQNEWTTNRVENIFRWLKYGESHDGNKVLSKKTSIRYLMQLIIREYRYRKVNSELKASAAATRSRSDVSQQDHAIGFSDGITDHAYSLANEQWVESEHYDVVRCDCDGNDGDDLPKWRVKRSVQPKDSSLPNRKYWKTRIVSVRKDASPGDNTNVGHHLTCSCTYWRAWGVPCRHVLRVFRLLQRTLVLADVDVRNWVEMYRAKPSTIRDILWSQHGVFERPLPEGPTIEVTPALQVSHSCNRDCPTNLASSWFDGDPTSTTNTCETVDAADPMGILTGRSNRRPSSFARTGFGSKGTEQSTTQLYTEIKTMCESMCALSSDHPEVEAPLLTMLQKNWSDLQMLLPEVQRPSAKEQGHTVVPGKRSKLSNDDRVRGKGEYYKPAPKKKSRTLTNAQPPSSDSSDKHSPHTPQTIRANWSTVKYTRKSHNKSHN